MEESVDIGLCVFFPRCFSCSSLQILLTLHIFFPLFLFCRTLTVFKSLQRPEDVHEQTFLKKVLIVFCLYKAFSLCLCVCISVRL